MIALFCKAEVILAQQWTTIFIDTITYDSILDETGRQSIAADESGNVHVVFKKARPAGGWDIYYSKKPCGEQWITPVLVNDPAYDCYDPVIAIEKVKGFPVIAYVRGSGNDAEIIYAWDSTGVWSNLQMTFNNVPDTDPSIAVDIGGGTHLAWITEDSTGQYKIAYGNNLSYPVHTQVLQQSSLGSFGGGASPVIAVKPDRTVHIVYRGDFGSYNIHHAYNDTVNGTQWTYEVIYTPNSSDFQSSIQVGPNSSLYLAISGNDGWGFPSKVYYTTKPPGGNWSFPQQVSLLASGSLGYLYLDVNNVLHLTYDEVSGNIYTGNVYYTSNASGTWQDIQLIGDNKTYRSTLTVDTNNIVHVVAYHGDQLNSMEIIVISSDTCSLVSSNITGLNSDGKFMRIYPNPVSDVLNIVVNEMRPASCTISVYNIIGKKLYSVQVHLRGDSLQIIPIDVSRFDSGLYFIEIKTATRKTVNRFTKN